jgi:pimeloyl-ACP methyl ester carboxylesterase
MPDFTNRSGLTLAFDDSGPGDGTPSILLHGFASNRKEGWQRTGWYAAFNQRRQRMIALDHRGHGESAKPHDRAQYGRQDLARDVLDLMDDLKIDYANLIGFSMGAHIALEAALIAPDRFDHLILAGIGSRMFEAPTGEGAMSAAMTAEDPQTISDPLLRSFRHFADEQGEDRLALAACAGATRATMNAGDLQAVRARTLVVVGARDDLAGAAEPLAAAISEARAVTLPACDHFATITHGLFKGAAFDFLDGWFEEI